MDTDADSDSDTDTAAVSANQVTVDGTAFVFDGTTNLDDGGGLVLYTGATSDWSVYTQLIPTGADSDRAAREAPGASGKAGPRRQVGTSDEAPTPPDASSVRGRRAESMPVGMSTVTEVRATSCGANPYVSMTVTVNNTPYGSSNPGSTCTIDVTSAPAGRGEHYTGTYEAELYAADGSRITVTAGRFDVVYP